MRVCLWARSCLGGLSDGRGIRVGIGRGAREKGYLVIDVGGGFCFSIDCGRLMWRFLFAFLYLFGL